MTGRGTVSPMNDQPDPDRPDLPVGRIRDDEPVLLIGDGRLANFPVHPPKVGWRASDGHAVVFGVGRGDHQYSRPEMLRQLAADLLVAADWLEGYLDAPSPVCTACSGLGWTRGNMNQTCRVCRGTRQVATGEAARG